MNLIESIKVLNKKFYNLEFHSERLNRSRKDLFGKEGHIDLSNELVIPGSLGDGLYKCRVVYSDEIISAEFLPYQKRQIATLKIIKDDNIEYSHKYEDRGCIDKLYQLKGDCDDILIIKNLCITDTAFSNIVFFDGRKWITPSSPLLKGIKREMLIRSGEIVEDEIMIKDLKKFKKASLINAMLDIGETVIQTGNIINCS